MFWGPTLFPAAYHAAGMTGQSPSWMYQAPVYVLSGLTAELAASATDYAKLIELGDELKAVQASKAELEDRWLEVAQEADPG